MILKYKNYIGKAEYDEDVKIYEGAVIGIRDVITFAAKNEEDLQQALQDSVEDYFEMCKESGKIPEKSHSGEFRVRVSPDTHARLAAQAAYKGISLNSLIDSILTSESNRNLKR